MVKRVIIEPSCISFPVNSGQSILEAALSVNINLDYSCSNGECGECVAQLVSGKVKSAPYSDNIRLTEEQLLTCSSYLESDVVLKADYYKELEGIDRKTIPAKVDSYQIVGGDIAIITLRLPPMTKFVFLPGQFVDLMWRGTKRSYSIAIHALQENKIELHVKKVEGGLFSDLIFNELVINQLFRFYGPLGTFFVRESNKPAIFLCTGAGFAPVKAMVEQIIESNAQREVYIYWGVRYRSDLYSFLPKEWAQQYSNISYTSVLSREQDIHDNEIAGYCQNAVVQEFDDLSGFEVYACGSENMIHEAKDLFIKQGCFPYDFYSDAFLVSN
jgi:CDP-4-dehydro-6-deoxyglucose reductase